ncbi:hypothetical protein G7Z17_g7 [Cylindrodendrum hubeiense]|uniref:Dipeptidase n=1 Tax=Cylindrodendrum hubeiense TaxID=595255 RepID=A0A9P5LGI8_9HYPO|nr:hypothetical protein G7Z17_g7 [Cylindrodendrum hubeiense]
MAQRRTDQDVLSKKDNESDNDLSIRDPVNDDSTTHSSDQILVLHPAPRARGWQRLLCSPFTIASLTLFFTLMALLWPGQRPIHPTNYTERTRRVLSSTPLIDGHNDLPLMLRIELHNRIYNGLFDFSKRLLGHTDLKRMRQGMWTIRDTLEQIDVTRRFISEHPRDLKYCDTATCVRKAFKSGHIASMIGIEGGHQVGSSIATIRQMYELGARYMTLTHNCDNAFATAASTIAADPKRHDEGLTNLGIIAVRYMNRMGMMVDLSHVSHQTMRDVLSVTRAPVIFSHSGAYGVSAHLRNVPNDVLSSLNQNGGIDMVVSVKEFLSIKSPEQASIYDVVDHVLFIAEACGWECVGIGSDFFGAALAPIGLEDVSKFPSLIELLMQQGVTDEQIRMLVGDNILRVWAAVEKRASEIQESGEKPAEEEYEERYWTEGLPGDPHMFRRGS